MLPQPDVQEAPQRTCWLAFCPFLRRPLNSPCFFFLCAPPMALSLVASLRGVTGALALAPAAWKGGLGGEQGGRVEEGI